MVIEEHVRSERFEYFVLGPATHEERLVDADIPYTERSDSAQKELYWSVHRS